MAAPRRLLSLSFLKPWPCAKMILAVKVKSENFAVFLGCFICFIVSLFLKAEGFLLSIREPCHNEDECLMNGLLFFQETHQAWGFGKLYERNLGNSASSASSNSCMVSAVSLPMLEIRKVLPLIFP